MRAGSIAAKDAGAGADTGREIGPCRWSLALGGDDDDDDDDEEEDPLLGVDVDDRRTRLSSFLPALLEFINCSGRRGAL